MAGDRPDCRAHDRPSDEGGKERENRNRCPGAGQREQPATRGQLFRFGNDREKPMAFHQDRKSIQQTHRHPCTSEAAGRPASGPVGQRTSGNERGKSASGSAQKIRTLRSRPTACGTECVHQASRSASLLLIVTRMGRDYRRGSPTANGAGRPQGSASRANRGQESGDSVNRRC